MSTLVVSGVSYTAGELYQHFYAVLYDYPAGDDPLIATVSLLDIVGVDSSTQSEGTFVLIFFNNKYFLGYPNLSCP